MTALPKIAEYWKQPNAHVGRLTEYTWYIMNILQLGKKLKRCLNRYNVISGYAVKWKKKKTQDEKEIYNSLSLCKKKNNIYLQSIYIEG